MKIERVVVTGGRHFHDVQRVLADLRALQVVGLVAVAQGGAAGADACARNSCDVLKIQCQTYPALWETDDRGAGPRRNIRMLEAERPDLVLAYPDPNSRGTWHCVQEALRRDIPVAVWHEDDPRRQMCASFCAYGALHLPSEGPTGFAAAFIPGGNTAPRTYWIPGKFWKNISRPAFDEMMSEWRGLLGGRL